MVGFRNCWVDGTAATAHHGSVALGGSGNVTSRAARMGSRWAGGLIGDGSLGGGGGGNRAGTFGNVAFKARTSAATEPGNSGLATPLS